MPAIGQPDDSRARNTAAPANQPMAAGRAPIRSATLPGDEQPDDGADVEHQQEGQRRAELVARPRA